MWKFLRSWIIELILFIGFITALFFFVMPKQAPVLPGAEIVSDYEEPQVPEIGFLEPGNIVWAWQLARFFGWEPEEGEAEPENTSRVVNDAGFLEYLGFSRGEEGDSYYFIKDSRTGRVMRIGLENMGSGWQVEETGDDYLILRNEEETWRVERGE
ncbi:MAG: hypothetical protein ACLFR1_11175 [Spirochaetia bacterium]